MRDNGPHRQFRAILLDGTEISVVKGFGTYSSISDEFDDDEQTSEVAFFNVNGEDFVRHPKFHETASSYFNGDSIYAFVPDVTIVNFIREVGVAELMENGTRLAIQ